MANIYAIYNDNAQATTIAGITGGGSDNEVLAYGQTGANLETLTVDGSGSGALTISGGNAAALNLTGTSGIGFPGSGGIAFTGTGTIAMGGNAITGMADPTGAQDAATKAYVDGISAGLDPKESCRASTTAALAAGTYTGTPTFTFAKTANGAIDDDDIGGVGTTAGTSWSIGDRLLVKDQADATQNGIYTVTDLGSAGTPWVLTRATDFDGTPANEVSGGAFSFIYGDLATEQGTGWTVVFDGNVVVDTDDIDFTQFSGPGTTLVGDVTGPTTATVVENISGSAGTALLNAGLSGLLSSNIDGTSVTLGFDNTATGTAGGLLLVAQDGASGNDGGVVELTGGEGEGAAAGGNVSVTGGEGGATGQGGALLLTAGLSNVTGTPFSGAVVIQTGGSASGDGGQMILAGASGAAGPLGAATVVDGAGGGVTVLGGAGVGSGNAGGAFSVTAGAGSSTGTAVGGNVTMTAGAGGSSSGTGGTMTLSAGAASTGIGGQMVINAGDSSDGNGGAISISSGDAGGASGVGGGIGLISGIGSGSGVGGPASMTAGVGGSTAAGGLASLIGGQGGSASGDGGGVAITAGAAAAGGSDGGNVTLTAGAGNGAGDDGIVAIDGTGSAVTMLERTAAPGNALVGNGTYGTVWVRETGDALMYTDQTGADFVIGGGGAGIETLSATLGAGNTTDGYDIEISDGDNVVLLGDTGTTTQIGFTIPAVTGTGSALEIFSQQGEADSNGGTALFRGGQGGSSTGNGGAILLAGGLATTSGSGGAATLTGGSSNLGAGGLVNITGGAATASGTSAAAGGPIALTAGNSAAAGASSTSDGAAITLTASAGQVGTGTVSSTGGSVTITAGDGAAAGLGSGFGGDILLQPGSNVGDGIAGRVEVFQDDGTTRSIVRGVATPVNPEDAVPLDYLSGGTGFPITGVLTGDTSAIPVLLASFDASSGAIIADTTVTILVRVGAKDNSDDDSAGYLLYATFENTGGTVSQIGSTSVIASNEDAGATGFNATIDNSGTTIRIMVTNDTPANGTDWGCVGSATLSR